MSRAFALFCAQEPPAEEKGHRRPFEQLFFLLLFNTENKRVIKEAAFEVAKGSYRVGLQAWDCKPSESVWHRRVRCSQRR